MKETILAYLLADTTLMGYLTGGLYNSWEHKKISDVRTPDAFDGGKVLPTGLLKIETETSSPTALATEIKVARFIFLVNFYVHQDADTDPIYNAKDRAYALLEGWKPATSWETSHAGDVLDVPDETIEATMLSSRYVILRRRA